MTTHCQLVSSTFSVFRSPWLTPCACAWDMPCNSWNMIQRCRYKDSNHQQV